MALEEPTLPAHTPDRPTQEQPAAPHVSQGGYRAGGCRAKQRPRGRPTRPREVGGPKQGSHWGPGVSQMELCAQCGPRWEGRSPRQGAGRREARVRLKAS